MTRLYEREIKDFFEVAKIKMAGTTKEGKGKFGKICLFSVYLTLYANSALSSLCSAFVLCLHRPFCLHLSDSNVIEKMELTLLALMLFLMEKTHFSLLTSKALMLYRADSLNC